MTHRKGASLEKGSQKDAPSQQAQVIWEKLRTSFWLVPTIMGLLGGLLAWLGYFGDLVLSRQAGAPAPPLVYLGTADHARDVIATLLSSMITMTSLVFSITMVVLTLAASQFGPRLIRSFMSSHHTQVVLGTFIMTTVYCLLVLGSLGSYTSQEQQPFASVSGAIALALASIALLVLFLHFLARSIVSETVIHRVGLELDHSIRDLEPVDKTQEADPRAALPAEFEQTAKFFGPPSQGYVQAIDYESLVAHAEGADVMIGLYFAPGDYVVIDGGGIGVYPADRCTAELERQISQAMLLGPHRTPTQDIEFSIRHLVEIAVRALSPGINDPYTAAAVINQLSASLSLLMSRAMPPAVLHDTAGKLRVSSPRATYATLLSAGFNQIRQNAAGKPFVVIYLIEAIIRIADHVRLESHRSALQEQLNAILSDARRDIPDGYDMETINARAETASRLLDRSTITTSGREETLA